MTSHPDLCAACALLPAAIAARIPGLCAICARFVRSVWTVFVVAAVRGCHMAAGSADLIDRLEDDWQELVQSGRMDAALTRWSAKQQALTDVDIVQLIEALDIEDPSANAEQDALLTVLLRISEREHLARRLLLHRFLPCVKELATGTPELVERDEWLTLLVTTIYEVVCTYPLRRRPTSIAANIACDFRKSVFETLRQQRRDTAELTDGPLRETDLLDRHRQQQAELSAVEAVELLRWAIDEGLVDESTAALLVLTRMYDLTVSWVASQVRTATATLRQRRRRAERRIAAALVSEVA